MSTTSLIRGALKKGSGPLTETEIAESIDKDAKSVRSLLYAMVKSGEVERDTNDEGKPTFVSNPQFKPARRRPGEEAATEAPPRAVRAAKGAKRAAKAAKKAARAKPIKARKQRAKPAPRKAARKLVRQPRPVATPAIAPVDTLTVSLQRDTLRSLLSFVLASERPLDARTRSAVIDAAREAA
jgi:hypothetical protein